MRTFWTIIEFVHALELGALVGKTLALLFPWG